MHVAAGVERLRSGRAFVDLGSWRKVRLSGRDALDWLNDLITADISDLRPGQARRSLLLSPRGRVRAEFTVARPGGDLVLLQDPIQPRRIDDLLAPYVLSSDVELGDRTGALALLAFPGLATTPRVPGATGTSPSCTGRGADLVVEADDRDAVVDALSERFAALSEADLEAWRVAEGIPRLGVDGSEDDLPSEAGFADAVATDKGCFMGQEAVARVRNLGHPRRLLVAVAADGGVSAGEAIEVDGRAAGELTSAVAVDGRWRALARVGWEHRAGPFRTATGVALTPVP